MNEHNPPLVLPNGYVYGQKVKVNHCCVPLIIGVGVNTAILEIIFWYHLV